MIRTKTLFLSIALVATPLVALLAAATPASAHICTAENPQRSCGECTGIGYHDHNYNNGDNYCNSLGAICTIVIISCPVAARGETTSSPVLVLA